MAITLGRRARATLGQCLVIACLLCLGACKSDDEPYGIGGQVTGLTASGLTLSNNGATPLQVSAGSTSFVFPDRWRKGSSFNVTVATQPAGLICTVTNGAGTIRGTVTDIRVACDVETHRVAGSIAGLTTDGLVLQMNGADTLAIPANASSFEFATPIAAGSGYQVTVLTQPDGLTCTVNNGSASNVNAEIDNVQVVCSAVTHNVGGAITGLTGTGLVLRNNGADDLTLAGGATSFQFASPIAYNGAYDVTVLVQPSGQTCSVANGSGTALTDIANIAVTCADIPTFTITASAGANGSISPSGAFIVNAGSSVGFVAMPDSGYAVRQWLVDGVPVQSGGAIYTVSNIAESYAIEVTFGVASLSTSVSSLALSVNGVATNAALTGRSRVIVVSNDSTTTPVASLSVSTTGLPSDTIVSSANCGSMLAPGSSCLITVTPGPSATSACTLGTEPTPGSLTVRADNAPPIAVDVVVLGYGCIYQGGYLFAIDDTTPLTTSIGGKAVTQSDQAIFVTNGVVWSSNGLGRADEDYASLGIAQGSLAPCVADYDGACNSTVMLSHYSPASTYPRAYFSAGMCTATIDGFSDWYLPAACEVNTCVAGEQSMHASLMNNGLELLPSAYWTSTESGGDPLQDALGVDMLAGSTIPIDKSAPMGVRCARALSH